MSVISFECIFAPTQEFEWRREDGFLIGLYVPGNTYNCTRFPVHAKLREKVWEWAQAGMVEIYPLGPFRRFVMTKPGED